MSQDKEHLQKLIQDLRESEERYRAIVEDQTEMICRSLQDTTLTFVNDSYARYFGKAPSELLGLRFLDFLPEQDANVMREFLESLTGENPVGTAEHRVIGMDGAERWNQWTDRAIFDEAGKLIEYQSVGRDITERKKAEAALQRSEELNRAVLASLRDKIAVLDRKGNIIAVNEGWTEFAESNRASGVGVGANYIDVCRSAAGEEPFAQRTLEGICLVLDGREDIYREEYPCDTPEGVKWFVLSVTPLRLPEGGAVVSHIDITERKHAEAALMTSREELRGSRDEVRRLAGKLIALQEEERSRVAAELHDGIGQSLAIIGNRVKRCLDEVGDRADIREQLEEMTEAVTAAINEVREIAHGLRPYELDRLGLKNAVESMIEQVRDSSGIVISADLDEVGGLLDERSETSIYRVVQEALHNVIEHSGARTARVSMKTAHGVLRVVITDNGEGFDNRSNVARNGFGISGIKERARMLGGNIDVRSGRGRGTTVELKIDLQNA